MYGNIEIPGWQKDPTIAAIVKAAFPSYRRKKVYVRASEAVTLTDLNWSGGTRSEYRAASLDGRQASGDTSGMLSSAHPFDNQFEGKSVPVPQGFVIVRGGHFCGKESILCLHVNPADMPKLLPAS